MKYSKQREMIFNCIKDNPMHLTADAIYEMLKKENPNLSLGTVYRNLSQLADHNMIQKVSIPGYPDRFDGTLMDHFHFLCLECGDIQDIFVNELFDVAKIVEDQVHVDVKSIDMSFKGICCKCKGHKIN